MAVFRWYYLQVIGSGTALALQIHGGIALPPNVDINPPADVGTAPANLNPFTASGNDILRLISFYNDTFGVIGADNLAARREKLMHWLTESFFWGCNFYVIWDIIHTHYHLRHITINPPDGI